MLRWFRSLDAYKALGIPMALLLVIFCILLMNSIAALYVRDLQVGLKELHKDKASAKSLWLVSYYRLILGRYQGEVRAADEFLLEGKIQSLLARETGNRPTAAQGEGVLESLGILSINFLNTAMGTDPLRYTGRHTKSQLFEYAYFLEHLRQFGKASQLYTHLLENYQNDAQEAAYLYLHRGFSLSVAGSIDPALVDFQRVVDIDMRGEMGITADTLRQLLLEIREKSAPLEGRNLSLETAESYFQLMAFEKAINAFNKLEASGVHSGRLSYYRGRSLEESGKIQNAVKDYTDAIRLSPGSQYAQDANRRLYMLGAYYNGGPGLKSTAKEFARLSGDDYILNYMNSPETRSYMIDEAAVPVGQASMELSAELSRAGIAADILVEKIVMPDFRLLLQGARARVFRFFLKNGNVIVGKIEVETGAHLEVRVEGTNMKIDRMEVMRREPVLQETEK